MGTPLVRMMKLPVPVLVDSDRSVYRAYGLERSLMVQKSATFVIDHRGVVRYARASFNPLASFEPREVREVLEGLMPLSG
jgi:peroxiredoxin